jgi:hypothetical protein
MYELFKVSILILLWVALGIWWYTALSSDRRRP